MMIDLALLLVMAPSVLGPVPPVPETGDLTKSDLISIQRLHQKLSATADQFTPDPANVFAGRRFRLIVPVDTEYMQASQRLSLKVSEVGGLNLQDHLIKSRSTLMTNGYGVRARVRDNYVVIYSVDFERWIAQPPIGSDDAILHRFHIEVPAEPEAARALAASAQAVLSGEVIRGADGAVVHCGLGGTGPATASHPTSTFGVACGVRVAVEDVTILNGSTGETLRSWHQ